MKFADVAQSLLANRGAHGVAHFPVADQSEFEASSFHLRCMSRSVNNGERLFAWMQASHEHNEGFIGLDAEMLARVRAFVGCWRAEPLAINAVSYLYDRFGSHAEFSL